MKRLSLAILIGASLLASGSVARSEDALSPSVLDHPFAVPANAPHAKTTRKKGQKVPVTTSQTPAPTMSDDKAAALARGRKKFFDQGQDQPDKPEMYPGSGARPTLGGGSGGSVSPGMSFAF
ncbi:hypothetical protein LGH83_15225 [Lichenihabitans sp. PAMC28606]|uniref:hypothetical protein n=1 Tax=Lichenihabitans sp. PAMC28606 TaxID=2880932 RepID=UPI001D0A0F7D|nr:hypothetical protein [Lichenihabitans sp. PAMC28606]UDL93896.1 hypothetical protein LGH83_15225 [Lichenihabitans sp. PAMC28606]